MNEQIHVITFEKGNFAPGLIMSNMLKVGARWLPMVTAPRTNPDKTFSADFGYSSSASYIKLMITQEIRWAHAPWPMDQIRKQHQVNLERLS